jgi:hypothetical protein
MQNTEVPVLNGNLSEMEKHSGPLGFHYKQALLCLYPNMGHEYKGIYSVQYLDVSETAYFHYFDPFHHCIQKGSGAHPASYPMGTRGSFPGDKTAGV